MTAEIIAAVVGLLTVIFIPLACVTCLVMDWGDERTLRCVVLASYVVGAIVSSAFVLTGLVVAP